jgi:hypothetical protein
MVYDVASGWALRNSVAAVDPFSCTDGSRPRIVMGYHRVFLLFPVKKEIVEYSLSLSILTKGRTMQTTIEPAAGVVTGLSLAESAATACTDGAEVDMGISNHSCSQTIDLLSQPRGLNLRISPTP